MIDEIEQYKLEMASMTERQRADREAELVAKHRPRKWQGGGSGRRTGIGDFLLEHGITNGTERSYIRRLGPAGDPLWARIEAGTMTLYMARTCSHAVWKLRGDLGENIRAWLAEYDATSTTDSSGKIVRRKRALWKMRKPGIELSTTDKDRVFWTNLKATLVARVREHGRESKELDAIVAQFCRDLDVLMNTYTNKVSVARRRETKPVTVAELADACARLALDEPSPGEDLAVWLADAAKQKKKFARACHPDVGGDRANYEAVIAAWLICERFAQERKVRV